MSECRSENGDSTIGLWCPPSWIGLLWGFAEGTLFFMIPDIALSWAALAGFKCGVKMLGAILAGSIVAGLCMYGWSMADPIRSRSAVASVPFVRAAMFDSVEASYRDHGASGMLRGPGSGIPYKIYAILAPPFMEPVKFAIVSVPARLERLALSWGLFTALGSILKRWVRPRPRLSIGLFTSFWILVYSFYWARI